VLDRGDGQMGMPITCGGWRCFFASKNCEARRLVQALARRDYLFQLIHAVKSHSNKWGSLKIKYPDTTASRATKAAEPNGLGFHLDGLRHKQTPTTMKMFIPNAIFLHHGLACI
jgi:hypothetical protein